VKKSKSFRRIFLPVFFLFITPVAFAQPTYVNKIPIPYRMDRSSGRDTLKLVIDSAFHNFNPAGLGNPSDSLNHLSTYVYNSKDSAGKPGALTLLGPTLIWHTKPNFKEADTIKISIKNNLNVNTTTHWHGAEIPAVMDGGPHQVINVGETWYPYFQNLDRSSTLWYHPHLHDTTVQQVSKGLSGMIYSLDTPDPINAVMPRTYGVDDIPLVLGDLGVKKTGNKYQIVEQKGTRPTNTVNSVTNPYVEVPAAWIRLRILNGSSRKGIQFGVSTANDSLLTSNNLYFTLLATDGGYTINTDNIPDTFRTLLTGPGSRNEILLNLTGRAGDNIYLTNMKQLMDSFIVGSLKNASGGGSDPTFGKSFLELRVKPVSSFPNYTPVTSIPPFSSEWDISVRDTSQINFRRQKQLNGSPGSGFTIDNKPYKMEVINDTICLGAKEIWTITNLSGVAHPFHIHKVFFRVLDIVDITKTGPASVVSLQKYGLNGPKDDVMILPNWKLRFLAKFDDFPTAISPHNCYMYHCHILTHEDTVGGAMMHQFVVTDDSRCFRDETKPYLEMSLFPNPTSGELFLKGISLETSTVQIFNQLGQLLRRQELDPFVGNTLINVDGIRSGLYFVKWNNSKGKFAQKLIISR
jgi:FtsP/CotA-like multicopper oxidase with cupredoxin domain